MALTDNTVALQALLETANSLPDGGTFDFSGATVTPQDLPEGVTAWDANGTLIVGERTVGEYMILPLGGLKEGVLPPLVLSVKAGDVVKISYFVTLQRGYIYDCRSCGGGYYLLQEHSTVLNAENTITVQITSNGTLSVSGRYTDQSGVVTNLSDCLYGQYVKVKVN